MMEFKDKNSNITIINNIFSKNLCDMSACIHAVQQAGILFLKNNKFIENYAITLNRIYIGTGSVIQLYGNSDTKVISSNNIYLFNEAEYSGFKFL